MRIATSKYLRYKMKISSSYSCSLCFPAATETLDHIYLKCPKTLPFKEKLRSFITNSVDSTYSLENHVYYFTCDHPNNVINFLNLVANWYIGRKVQNEKVFYWDEYLKFVKQFLIGEKTHTRTILEPLV